MLCTALLIRFFVSSDELHTGCALVTGVQTCALPIFIPTTFVSALSERSILQALFAAILFGLALSHAGEPGRQVLGLLEKVSVVFFGLVGMLMKFAPIGALDRKSTRLNSSH